MTATQDVQPSPHAAAGRLQAPWPHLATLPRALWQGAVTTSDGTPAARLRDAPVWLRALAAGTAPPQAADFGTADATAALRGALLRLQLPTLARQQPALAEAVLRSVWRHLDGLADRQPQQTRAEAIAAAAQAFAGEWQPQTEGLEADLALLRTLGDASHLSWQALRGLLRSRPWAQAREAAQRLAQLPAVVALIERLGRAERHASTPPAAQALPDDTHAAPLPLHAVVTVLPGAPGEIVGLRWASQIERMPASEAVMLRHPVLRRWWHARQAEGRLLNWASQAVVTDWRVQPHGRERGATRAAPPQPLARGPIVLCLDTSGSMRGAPERIAKAIVIATLRTAHAQGRACRLFAFGGPGEVVAHELGAGEASLDALMAVMGQSFDGGTDVQTPIERAIATVHEAQWRSADLLIVSDGEFGCVPQTLQALDEARARLGLRVQGVLVGDRETMGLLEVCDHIHWEREWRRFADDGTGAEAGRFSPVHSQSLTALYFPNALSPRAARHHAGRTREPGGPR